MIHSLSRWEREIFTKWPNRLLTEPLLTMRYFTILFDFDGTLADTESVMRESLNAIAKKSGFLPISETENETLRGMNAREFLTTRLGISPWNIVKTIHLIRRTRREFIARAGGIRLFPGVADLLRQLKAAGFQVGIVSTNTVPVMKK